ncbi:Uncharacterised protein [uncultured archaeon]|nr:Uncharacterised protein [uncultured archaeon]
MKFNMKIHENAGTRVVAVCDSALLGKVFEDGARVLDLKAYASFYGTVAGEREVLQALKNFTSLNLVGRDAVALAVKAGILEKTQVLEIGGVPHAQAYKI